MEYQVIPFVASIELKSGNSSQVANQLEEIIKNYSILGWEYVRLESVTTVVQPAAGCFGFGGSPGFTTTRQMIVFCKEK